jgi:hypothetical protein
MGYFLALGRYQNILPLFGSANQLLAALALIACAVFLKKNEAQQCYAVCSIRFYAGGNIFGIGNQHIPTARQTAGGFCPDWHRYRFPYPK